MTTKAVSIRIALDGKPQVKSDLQDIAKTGNDAGTQVAGGFDQASAAVDRQTAALQRMAAAARQAQAQSQGQSSFNTLLGVNTGAATNSAKESADFYKQYFAELDAGQAKVAALRAQIDPLSAAQVKMNSAVADASLLLKTGAISETEHAAAVKLAQTEYAEAEKALRALSNSAGLSNGQMMALTATVRHSIDAVIAGRPPLQALAMESGNLTYALGSSGVSGVFGLVGKAAQALLSPVGLVVGGIAAAASVAVVAGAALKAYIDDQKNFEQSLSGVGRASGATVDQMEQIAESTAAAAGVSVASARSIEEAFAQSGKIGVDQFSGLIDIVKRYAATTGETVDQATKELTQAFSDPAKGVDLLNSKVGGLDDKTRQYITTLEQQGDRQAAQNALLKALVPNLDAASAHTTAFGREWAKVAGAADGALEAIKKAIGAAIDGPQLADQLRALQQERADAANGIGKVVGTGTGAIVQAPRALVDIDADIAKVRAGLGQASDDAKKTATVTAAAVESIWAGSIARTIAGTADLDTLKAQLARVNADLVDPNVTKRVTDMNQLTAAQDALTRAVQTYLDPQTKAQQLADLETKALNDKTPAEKAATAAERERIEISGKLMTTTQANADIERARTKTLDDASKSERDRAAAVARQTAVLQADTQAALDDAAAWLKSAAAGMEADAARKAISDSIKKGSDADQRAQQILREEIAQTAAAGARQVSQVEGNYAAQKDLNDAVAAGTMTSEQAREQMQIEQTLRPLIVAQALAEGAAKDKLTEIIKRLTAAYQGSDAETRRAQAQAEVESQKDQLTLMQKELDLQGESDNARQVELARLQAMQELKRQNIDLDSEEGKQYVANAEAIAKMGQQLDQVKADKQEMEGLFDDLASKFTDFIDQGKLDWQSFGDLGKSVITDLINEMIKLSLINPLKNALFGERNPTTSSIGGIFGSIFGNSSAILDTNSLLPLVPIGHTGGKVGGLSQSRGVSPNVFAGAKRYHTGGLLPGEVPIIAQEGERILNRTETKAYDQRQKAAAGPAQIQVVVSVSTDGNSDASATANVANNGGMDITTVVDSAVSKAMSNPNSSTSKTLRHRFGTTPQLVKRG